jgi:hypothetical protein
MCRTWWRSRTLPERGRKEEEGLSTGGVEDKVEVEVPLEVGGEAIWLGIHSTEVFKAGQI